MVYPNHVACIPGTKVCAVDADGDGYFQPQKCNDGTVDINRDHYSVSELEDPLKLPEDIADGQYSHYLSRYANHTKPICADDELVKDALNSLKIGGLSGEIFTINQLLYKSYRLIHSKSEEIRRWALWSLAYAVRPADDGGTAVADKLLYALENDRDEEVRHMAAVALGKKHFDSTIAGLINVFGREESRSVLIAVLWSLTQMCDQLKVPPLLEKLDSPDYKNRTYAAATLGLKFACAKEEQVLGELPTDEVIGKLTYILMHDENALARRVAAYTLCVIGGQMATGILATVLHEGRDPSVREAAEDTLNRSVWGDSPDCLR